MTEQLKQAAQDALDALEEIALAGMSGTGQESEEGMRAWHARQAWKFIGIAARALDPLKSALTTPQPAQAGVSDEIVNALVAQSIFFKEGVQTVEQLRSEVRAMLAAAQANVEGQSIKRK